MTKLLMPSFVAPKQLAKRADHLFMRIVNCPDSELLWFTYSFQWFYDEVLDPEFGVGLIDDEDLGFDDTGHKLLGRYDFRQNIIYVDKSLSPSSGDRRRAFTLWHEAAHAILHRDWMLEHQEAFIGQRTQTCDDDLKWNPENRLEYQANIMAACLGAPSRLLYVHMMRVFGLNWDLRYRGPGDYTLTVSGTSRRYKVESFGHLCRLLAYHIKDRFGGLSEECLGYRIQQLPLVRNCEDPHSQSFLYRRAK